MWESHVSSLILLDQALTAVTLPSSHRQQGEGYINLTMTDGLGFEVLHFWKAVSDSQLALERSWDKTRDAQMLFADHIVVFSFNKE